ncbi:aspartyl protease family protein 2-like [Abrus precatorius]|uniref:Aspartyl protease family protein 2-like n=1 Tax=Abrus precatorius TaxID=3816 RepID=A0A8B8MIL7_ABRPR|nr:aspartyl protease family protein 2-like [Abrus precatorius]
MVLKVPLIVVILVICSCAVEAISGNHNLNKNGSSLAAIKFPNHPSFNAVSSSGDTDCSLSNSEQLGHSGPTMTSNEEIDDDDDGEGEEGEAFLAANPHKQSVKLHLKHRSASKDAEPKKSVIDFTVRDLTRIQTLHRRVIEKKNQNTVSRLQEKKSKPVIAPAASPEYFGSGVSSQLVATLESGVSLGSGEYFMDVFVGTPPKHFSLILDTGSDLNWIQCVPCMACFEQSGPYYDPKDSSSFKNISCHDPRCQLVSSPDPPKPCKNANQTCPYFYWYGDSSNTTGDFALETFTVNLTTPSGKSELNRVENVMFGCGHWNRGLFHGAAGLLGLGRGPLSFASQLQSLYGHSFSYCLVDRNSNASVSSKLIFGEDKELLGHPNLNFTSFVGGKENPVDTFYYVQIKSVMVDDEVLKIPEDTWHLTAEGGGGTIIDSGTTLTYFADPAYEIIKEAFVKKIRGYDLVEGFPPLKPCYNVSGIEKMELPDFGILFADGAVWNFPVENYFIQIEPDVVCLAILGTPRSALSIIGNYQQQNFHLLYDTKKSRLGYAPMKSSKEVPIQISKRVDCGNEDAVDSGLLTRPPISGYPESESVEMVALRFHQYQVVGRALPTENDEHPKMYRMKLWATNEVRAKSKFWYFLRKLKKVKKSNGLVLAINEIFEKNPTKIKNYGIWLRYQSRTGYHNMYKEYRDTTLNGAVEQMYNEMASRHRVRHPCIQIIKTATVPAKLCKRESTKQFHDSKIKFPLMFKKVRPPTRKLKTTYKASKPNLFM